ncbi:MAG: histidine phosphatase family protein [Desulfobacteraceae bacterium]
MNSNQTKSTLVLLRHAERPLIPSHSFGNYLSITQKGKIASFNYGKKIGSHLHAVHSSPVKRCIETALSIIEGSNKNITVIPNTLLGDPGAFIFDEKLAGENWKLYGHDGVCERLFFSDEPMKGFYPPEMATNNLYNQMITHLPPKGKTTLFITHDIIIATLAVRILRLKHFENFWPEYLAGPKLYCNEGKIELNYKGFIYVNA